MKISTSPFRIGFSGVHVVRVGAVFTSALLLIGGAPMQVFAAAPSSTLRFALPGGAAIFYGDASNPHVRLSERTWKQGIFHFPNGTTFSLLPRAGESNAGDTELEAPRESDIAPSGQYVVIGRVESGMVSSGPGQPESVLGREFCSVIEIHTGCITADQTGEICGAGWQTDRPAQWGSDDDSNVMLKRDRPSAARLLRAIRSGQPARLVIDDDSGVDNLLRCDPPSSANRASYQKIVAALNTAGGHDDAQLIDTALSTAYDGAARTPALTVVESEHYAGTISAQKAPLYLAPDDTQATRAYLVQNDAVTVLTQSPAGWAYVDYAKASGKHLLRWIKADQVAVKP